MKQLHFVKLVWNLEEDTMMAKGLFIKLLVLAGLFSVSAANTPLEEAYRITVQHTPMHYTDFAKAIGQKARSLSDVEISAILTFAQASASNDRLLGRLYFRAKVEGGSDIPSSEQSFSCDILFFVSAQNIFVGDCLSSEGAMLWWGRTRVSFSFEELEIVDCRNVPQHRECVFPQRRLLW